MRDMFRPMKMIMPLDIDLPSSPHLRKFIKERLAKGDPGPLHIEDGEYFTPMSLEEEN